MEVAINWIAVGVATLAAMIIGSVWYSPPVFGNKWMKLAGISRKDTEKGGWTPIVIAIVASLATAFVLAHVTYLSYKFFGGSFLNAALNTAFWTWLGFSATTLVVHNSFELKRKKLTLLNAAYQLVIFMVAGLIIGLMGVQG